MISIALYVIGSILILAGAIDGFNLAMVLCCKADAPASGEYLAMFEVFASGILSIGAAVVIEKLSQIEYHLRPAKAGEPGPGTPRP